MASYTAFAVLLVLAVSASYLSAPAEARDLLSTKHALTDKQVLALWSRWNAALKTLEPEKVAHEYAPHGILVPTVSNKVRTTHDQIVDYFEHFLLKKPTGVINSYYIRWPCKDAVNLEGIYTFTMGVDGSKVQARFSYQWKRQSNGKWLILEHHSSAMPETVAAPH